MAKKSEVFYHIKKFSSRITMTGLGCIMLVTVVSFLIAVMLQRDITTDRDVGYCTDLNLQMKKSVSAFLDGMNATGKVLFSNGTIIPYEGTIKDPELEERIDEYLLSVCVVDNYADYGIVYENGTSLGRISDGCRDLFNDNIYGGLSLVLGDGTSSWFTGFYDEDKDVFDFNKLYYVRRINRKALFVSSCYSIELESRVLTEFSSTDLRSVLCDEQGRIIFDTGSKSPSETVEKEIISLFLTDKDSTFMDNHVIASCSDFDNGWRLITVIELQGRAKQSYKFALIMLVVAFTVFLIFEIIVQMSAARYDPERISYSESDNVDTVTGLHNAFFTENVILDKIEMSLTGSTFVLMIVNIVNLNAIDETYGEEVREEAMVKVAQAIDDLFGPQHTVGIMKRDEFAVFADFTDINLMKAYDDIKTSVAGLAQRLKRCELDAGRGEIRTAVGAALYPDCTADYDELLEFAETAARECRDDRSKDYVIYKKKGDVKAREEETEG